MSKPENLQISHDEFLAILAEWDRYMEVMLYRTKDLGGREAYFSAHEPEDFGPYAYEDFRNNHSDKKKLSEVSDLLWQSFQTGSENVENIHASEFADQQAERFRRHYINDANHRIEWLELPDDNQSRSFPTHYQSHGDPMYGFGKLGSVARRIIATDGTLDIAIRNYEKLRTLEKEYARQSDLRAAECRKKEEQRREVERKVREIDQSRCVFCGSKPRRLSLGYLSDCTDPFETDNVVVICRNCSRKAKSQRPEPKFGRFASTHESHDD